MCIRLGSALSLALLILSGCEPLPPGEPRDAPDADMFEGELDVPDADLSVRDAEVDAGPPPGSLGGPCRDDGRICDGDLRCIEGLCTAPRAGELDQPCRGDEPMCDPALLCADGICRPDPGCDAPCDFGQTECVDGDVEGYRVCGGLIDSECTAFGGGGDDPVVVRCDGERICQGGACVPTMTDKADPEVILVIDRAGFADADWPRWRDAVLSWIGDVEPAIWVGGQRLAGDEACMAGPGQARESFSSGPMAALLDQPAPAADGRPIGAALARVTGLLGPATEGQYAVLITTGGDECGGAGKALRHVQFLRGLGVRTRVVRVDLGDAGLDAEVDALGQAGGLSDNDGEVHYREVDSPAGLRRVLDELAAFADPACVDPDRDGYGPFCAAGADCRPGDEDVHAEAPELCDGVDNDCDDVIDETLDLASWPLADRVDGVCEGARKACEAGEYFEPNYLEIEGYEHRRELSCDGLDNDCDGRTDEALGDRSGPCGVGVGECARQGSWVCNPDNPAVSLCSAIATEPVDEICDGLDNDCDARIDEDAVSDDPEACNGRDDDCDARIDEDVDLGLCPTEAGEVGLACREGVCLEACEPGMRDADNQPGCEAPGYGDLALGDGFTCLIDPASGQPECYGRPDAPIPVGGQIASVAAGGRHACVIFGGDRDGEVQCDGPDATISAGIAGRHVAVDLGIDLACALDRAGAVTCWSSDARSAGVFGRNRVNTDMTVGGHHVCARDAAGVVVCFGACGGGCDGQGEPPAGVRFEQISAGLAHTCGIERDTGRLRCWGAGSRICEGALCAQDQEQAIPPAGDGYRAIAAGNLHTCAINHLFRVECWGLSDDGRLNPPNVEFSALWAGGDHTCGRRLDGSVRCWGADAGGETAPLD